MDIGNLRRVFSRVFNGNVSRFQCDPFPRYESKRGNCHYLFDRSKNILPHCSRFCFEPATPRNLVRSPSGLSFSTTTARFHAWRQQAARPRIVKNDSTVCQMIHSRRCSPIRRCQSASFFVAYFEDFAMISN